MAEQYLVRFDDSEAPSWVFDIPDTAEERDALSVPDALTHLANFAISNSDKGRRTAVIETWIPSEDDPSPIASDT